MSASVLLVWHEDLMKYDLGGTHPMHPGRLEMTIALARDLGLTPENVNVNGGAISMGHPVGMSGARLVLHLALELTRRGGGLGAAALCGGGGQGDALLVRVPA